MIRAALEHLFVMLRPQPKHPRAKRPFTTLMFVF